MDGRQGGAMGNNPVTQLLSGKPGTSFNLYVHQQASSMTQKILVQASKYIG